MRQGLVLLIARLVRHDRGVLLGRARVPGKPREGLVLAKAAGRCTSLTASPTVQNGCWPVDEEEQKRIDVKKADGVYDDEHRARCALVYTGHGAASYETLGEQSFSCLIRMILWAAARPVTPRGRLVTTQVRR